MNEFLKAKITEISEGASYGGKIYDYNLVIQTKTGHSLSVFDPDAISNGLPLETELELFVVASLVKDPQPGKNGNSPASWNAQVEDLNWKVPQCAFRTAHSDLYHLTFVRLKTPMGHMFLIRGKAMNAFWSQVQVGDFLTGQIIRWDLYAVV